MSDSVSRKDFVTIVGTATAAAAVPSGALAADTPMPPMAIPANTAQPGSTAALGSQRDAYTFFSLPEARFIEAAVERLIPTDERGPGARSAGCAFFIDRQLVGAFGTAAKVYRNGPWAEGTPMQGYQLRQTPAEVYRQGIAATEAYCKKTYQDGFAALTSTQQDEVLKGLEAGTITFQTLPSTVFFEMLLQNTIEGFFADPLYGGNRDKVGWKLVGFPGVAAMYGNKITDYDKPYLVPPVSIVDVQHGAPVAAGHELMHHVARENAKRLEAANQ